jgi:phospholipid/cholesterol/gamma-HCH transport system substrate-binding protein
MSSLRKVRGHVLVVAAALAVGSAFSFALWYKATAPHDGVRMHVMVPSAVSLGPGASVRIAGIKVGRVTEVKRRGAVAILGLSIDRDNAPVPTDTRVAVRLRSLVGETYVQLYPGHSARLLAENGVLPTSQAVEYVDADQLLDTLRGSTRQRVRQLLRGMGTGLDGRGTQLNELLAGATGTLEGGSKATRILVSQREQIARLVDNLGLVSQQIGTEGGRIRAAARSARTTFASLATQQAALRTLLRELPPTLTEVRRAAGTLRQTSDEVAPVLDDTAALVADLKPAVARLSPATAAGRRLVQELGRAAAPLEATLTRVRDIAGPTAAAAPALRRTLCQVNPAARYLKPYGEELARVFSHMGSAANFYDATGHSARLVALVSEGSVFPYGQSVSKAVDLLLESGLLRKVHQNGYNPYPPAGRPGPLGPGEGITGPEAARTKEPYTRVTADC